MSKDFYPLKVAAEDILAETIMACFFLLLEKKTYNLR